ncbi:hypothetical protein [Chitinophaga tropicalis]|uniref:Uncharacterized protein n=1 Tax=Chitinophaga tropicalis TaxID=2683588 RepID=A0A7K1TZI4_9BACT|nr:hypothetical protein [Chitinophaga tropicalis]MVT07503.1 hypothetical protein [Chitinophaga tropicalis]
MTDSFTGKRESSRRLATCIELILLALFCLVLSSCSSNVEYKNCESICSEIKDVR